jgi:predicted transposase YbfD/YdcC
MLTLVTFLKKVNDPRQNSGKRHPLWLILLLVILGMMFGHLGYKDIAAFGKAHQKLIVNFFQLSGDRLPSYSTIRRAMMLLDTSNLIEVFNEWVQSLSSLSADAQTFASNIRGHWLIENQLHWVKDVIFQEDRWSRQDYKAVSNLSILSTCALNLYRF